MDKQIVRSELKFKATRSSGAGGQHVNKTSSRVELYWSLEESQAFDSIEKARLRRRLAHRLTTEGVLQLASQQSRSQHQNKVHVTNRFLKLLEIAIVPQKARKKTRPSKLQHLKRLQLKKRQAEKKTHRKKPDY